jgi:hypothetical protein
VQLAIDVDQLEQPVLAKFIQQAGNDKTSATSAQRVVSADAHGAQCPSAYRPFQPLLFVSKRSGPDSEASALRQPATDVAHRCEFGLQLLVGQRKHRRYSQRNCAPPLAPGQHQLRPAQAQHVALPEDCQLRAVRCGLRSQL